MTVWVQLPAFPVHFYHREVLFSVGNMIGRTIKLDYHTLHQQRAKFARIAVEVDLSKALVTRIRLDGAWQYLEYENLSVLCFECGKIGHTKEFCPTLKPETPKLAIVEFGKPPEPEKACSSEEEKIGFGPWMVVTRKSRKGNKIPELGKGSSTSDHVDGAIQGKGGKGKITNKEIRLGTDQATGNKKQGSQRADTTNGYGKLGKNNIMAAKQKGKAKAEDLSGMESGEGLLGPAPPLMRPKSSKPRGKVTQEHLQMEGPSSSTTKTSPSTGLKEGSQPATQAIPDSPSLTLVPNSGGISIQVVNLSPSALDTGKQMEATTPSASARTKNQKKHRKKLQSPSNSPRPFAAKALQIWTPVKDKKHKARTKLAALTLQEIEAWTGTTKRTEETTISVEQNSGDGMTATDESPKPIDS
ncbi:unnamed protein product [Linum tenue]|uniref:CCHC-type domain-containing protein n=1 Tax=Linum tenue TaxID=586396 RepID=A0AAV0P6F6_9ROSI|nr:unnamed protein product [Linum tenue]